MSREQRKDQHVILAKQLHREQASDFDQIYFEHDAFIDIDTREINIKTEVAGIEMEIPFYINAMTGGSRFTASINRQLAQVAKEVNIAMAVGSQKAAVVQPELEETYRCVRQENPQGIVLANVGIDSTPEQAQAAIKMIEANFLQVHLNRAQEMIMPEGDRDFSQWSTHLKAIMDKVDVPVIVKEVGFGMSEATVRKLIDCGVKTVDLAGRGGTNFIEIEDNRRAYRRYEYLYGYGLSVVDSLIQTNNLTVQRLASGGVRNPYDIVKCLALGAQAVGIAGPVLRMLDECGVEETIVRLREWIEDIKIIMGLLGVRNLEELHQVKWERRF